jgi:glycosyltransferase involved in cell wall biosynthesis
MIVKDEAHVIARCLRSIKPLISGWCITDTGSSDNTAEIIRKELEGIPGELHSREWKGFGQSRNESIVLASEFAAGKSISHLLTIDADDMLEFKEDFKLPPLVHDSYEIKIRYGGSEYERTHIFRASMDFQYVGAYHEYLKTPPGANKETLSGVRMMIVGGGARSLNPQKYRDDAEGLEAELLKEPNNPRYMFYLGQSWRDAGEPEKAIAAYEKRTLMGGFPEEIYFSLLEIGKLLNHLDGDPEKIMAAYLKAYEYRPTRIESLFWLARYLRFKNRFALAAVFAQTAMEAVKPGDKLFVTADIYEWRALDEYAISVYYRGEYEKALKANESLLSKAPMQQIPRIMQHIKFCNNNLRKEG